RASVDARITEILSATEVHENNDTVLRWSRVDDGGSIDRHRPNDRSWPRNCLARRVIHSDTDDVSYQHPRFHGKHHVTCQAEDVVAGYRNRLKINRARSGIITNDVNLVPIR